MTLLPKISKAAWNSIAATRDDNIGRGNFLFGHQAITLLEFVARLCKSDSTGEALQGFSDELNKIEPKYFTQLPAPCASNKDFDLPFIGDNKENQLLWALFDLTRNGLAHQYQQILVELNKGKNFFITLTGAEYGQVLNVTAKPSRPDGHLSFHIDSDGDLGLSVRPDLLFLHFEYAINQSHLLNRNLTINHLSRPIQKNKRYHLRLKVKVTMILI